MKSIMEEATSVAKAIEKGWVKAGQPKNFSVKIFEYPERNFFGITTKNAKIAILFEEQPAKALVEHTRRPKKKPAGKNRVESEQTHLRFEQQEETPLWTNEMIAFATKWLKEVLRTLNKKISFSTQVNKDQLLITFDSRIYERDEHNKRLIRPLSQLMVQTLRNNFKKPLRGYKVIMKIN